MSDTEPRPAPQPRPFPTPPVRPSHPAGWTPGVKPVIHPANTGRGAIDPAARKKLIMDHISGAYAKAGTPATPEQLHQWEVFVDAIVNYTAPHDHDHDIGTPE